MANYTPMEVETMVLVEDSEVDYSGVSISDDRPGQYRVYWSYNPSTSGGGISGNRWPSDILSSPWNLQSALSQLDASNPNTVDAVSAIIYEYTSNILENGTGDQWVSFRNYYRDLGCLVF